MKCFKHPKRIAVAMYKGFTICSQCFKELRKDTLNIPEFAQP